MSAGTGSRRVASFFEGKEKLWAAIWVPQSDTLNLQRVCRPRIPASSWAARGDTLKLPSLVPKARLGWLPRPLQECSGAARAECLGMGDPGARSGDQGCSGLCTVSKSGTLLDGFNWKPKGGQPFKRPNLEMRLYACPFRRFKHHHIICNGQSTFGGRFTPENPVDVGLGAQRRETPKIGGFACLLLASPKTSPSTCLDSNGQKLWVPYVSNKLDH